MVFILDDSTLNLDSAWLYHIPHPTTIDNQHSPAAYEIKQLARKDNAVIGYGHDMDKF
jgi:hypothetical protein